MRTIFCLFIAPIVFHLVLGVGVAGNHSPARAVGIQKYARAHSLGENYKFDPRDGWEAINVTNLQYKYRRDQADREKSFYHGHKIRPSSDQTGPGGVAGILDRIRGVIKGIGKSEEVTVTWYTGHDLQNPSCWANGHWAPTDESFACALTLEGWKEKPKCFKFIELCHNPITCIFVRVVDTCAGCAKGSKHVDLTKAAFKNLAKLEIGVLTVQMRPATDPEEWFEKLWGPQDD